MDLNGCYWGLYGDCIGSLLRATRLYVKSVNHGPHEPGLLFGFGLRFYKG